LSSNIKIQRICQFCGNEFTAKTTKTQFCSVKCASRAYKARKKIEKIELSEVETARLKKQLTPIPEKEFLSVNETAALLGFSRNTVYRLIKENTLIGCNFGKRLTRVSRQSIDNYMQTMKGTPPKPEPLQYDLKDCITITEAQKRYNVSKSTIYKTLISENVPKIKSGKFTFVPIETTDRIFKELKK